MTLVVHSHTQLGSRGHPRWRQVWRPAASLVLVLAASASLPANTGDEPEDTQTAADFLVARFDRVKELIRIGDFASAFRLADALLVVAPDVPFRAELQRLRRLAEGRYLGANIVGARFEFTPGDTGFPRRVLVGDLVIENLSEKTLEIGGSGKSPVLGQARFRVSECYADGSEWSAEGTRNVTVPTGFELKVGEVRRVPVRLELPVGGAQPVLQRFSIRGSFGATQVSVGDDTPSRSVPWQETSEIVFREDLDAVRDDPYKHLQIGLLGADYARCVVAIDLLRSQLIEGLLDEGQQDRLVDMLTGLLDDSNVGLNTVLFRLLERFTGVRCEPRPESWKLWAGLRKGGRGRD